MALTFQPYNLTLPSYSPVFTYTPFRDGPSSLGWNSSYTDYSVTDTIRNSAAVPLGYYRGFGIAYRETEYAGATVSLNFTGSAVYMCFSTDGSWIVTLDGQEMLTTGHLPDDACSGYGSLVKQMSVATNISSSSHSIILQASGGSTGAMSFFGAVVTMNAGQPGPKKTNIINSDDPGWDWQGAWIVETDDTYMWNGVYRAGATYAPDTIATYTFKGASAFILRGLSMFNYGPYTITLDGMETSSFNASDLYWRHSETILYFASGLDPSVPHTISVMNYVPAFPKVMPLIPGGLVSSSVSTLILVMDDTVTRDAMLAVATPSRPAPSMISAGTIAAAVLGGLLLLVLGLNVLLFVLWSRLKKETRYTMPQNEPEKDMLPPLPVPWALNTHTSSTARINSETASLPSSGMVTPVAAGYSLNNQRREKRMNRTIANPDPVEMTSMSSHTNVNQSQNVQGAPRSPELGELVQGLSTLLNTHLHKEYLQREREETEGYGPPVYRDN
ncbi:hypothetical protein DACRYDRAFT_104697 [Dacryopinax primogenitus]|uniref:Uncharacterized protein n=1 Tax=Dacryopinax primogenitus (strain DJM 731) TaxID=1858805 RepID=M5G9C6_DACPD|nr:uncharacterized protein DACRYDRAFT_104697 [Dacryopinax primogenitus]EJU04825.1 hypothetical protein DACRYDRAFT_104697 [Dacryopinax primogenitus]